MLLGIAICSEVFGDSMMKLSNGFRRPLPTLGMTLGYLMSFWMLSKTLEELSLGFAYAVWTSGGIALTAVVSTVIWKERFNWRKGAGILLIIFGVALLKIGGSS